MKVWLRFDILGVLSLLVYGSITWLSQGFVYGQGHSQRPIPLFVGLYLGAWSLYMLALLVLPRLSDKREHIWLILIFALLFRLTLLFSRPIQEDDFYRYLWDGKVVASGLNPYRVAPLTVVEFTQNATKKFTPSLQETESENLRRLAHIPARDDNFALILSRVNHPEVPTIYPPLAQAIFALAALIAPGSLLVLRLIFCGFDLLICFLVFVVLQHLKANTLSLLIYAWSPLVLKETLNSAHYDVVPTFFFMLALVLALKDKTVFAHVSLAVATLGKLYPLLLLPVFLWRTWLREGQIRAVLGVVVVATVLTLGYAPFLDVGPALWQGTLTFAERWQMNSLIFPFLSWGIGERWGANTVVAILLGGTTLALLSRYAVSKDSLFLWVIFLVLGELFLLSPVGNPWYFLWLVPFLCVFPLRSWLLLSGLLGLYYLWFYFVYRGTVETFRWVIWLEYLPFYSLLVWDWLKYRENPQQI